MNLGRLIAAAVAPRFILRDQAPEQRKGFDLPGALAITAGLISLVYGVVKAPQEGWGSATTLGFLGAAVLLVTTVGPVPSDTMSIAIGSLDRLLSPAPAVVPAQLLAWRLSLTSGRIPGSYVHASKVTTRE